MDLRYTPAQQAFRAEVRDWLRANVPKSPLPATTSREGLSNTASGKPLASRLQQPDLA